MKPKAVRVQAPPAARPVGRPRSEKTRKAILKAAFQLLKKHSFADVSSEQIARQARVSTATLYRWWKNKQGILLDAYLEKTRELLPYGTRGSALSRLKRYSVRVAEFLNGDDGQVFLRLMLAIQDDPSLAAEFRQKVFIPRRTEGCKVIEEAIRAGELPADTDADFLMNILLGPQILPALLGQKISRSSAEGIFDFLMQAARNG